MIVQVPCSTCNGGGVVGVVTRDMATDAGEPGMEGMEIPCNACGGQGRQVEEMDDD